MKLSENHRVYIGKTFEVEFFVTRQGRIPAHDYYQSLSDDAKRRFFVIIGHFADAPLGTILPKSILNIEDKNDRIDAFKPFIHRFFCFFASGRKIIILNAYQKHAQKMTKADRQVLSAAKRMRQDYEQRVKDGAYYAG